MNGYQKTVLVIGALLLCIILIPSNDLDGSIFTMETLLKGLAILVVMGLFLFAFKDLGKGKQKGKKE